MTQTVNGHKVTGGDDVRMRVRAPENPTQAPDRADSGRKSAFTPVHTRVIPDRQAEINDQPRSKVHNFASQHVADAADALDQSWLFTEVPTTVGEAWKTALPTKGEASGKGAWLAMSAAGLFRASAVTFLHLLLLAVGTRLRAGVTLILFILATSTSCAAHHL